MTETLVPINWSDEVEHRRKLAEAINQFGHDWNSWSSVVTSTTGSITTIGASAFYYKQVGSLVFIHVGILITTNGTGGGAVRFTLPVRPLLYMVGCGREVAVGGKMLQVLAYAGNDIADIINYDNTYPGGDGHNIVASLFYQSV